MYEYVFGDLLNDDLRSELADYVQADDFHLMGEVEKRLFSGELVGYTQSREVRSNGIVIRIYEAYNHFWKYVCISYSNGESFCASFTWKGAANE